MTLKFVLSRLDANVGKRVSVSGILLGAGGADGINVSVRDPGRRHLPLASSITATSDTRPDPPSDAAVRLQVEQLVVVLDHVRQLVGLRFHGSTADAETVPAAASFDTCRSLIWPRMRRRRPCWPGCGGTDHVGPCLSKNIGERGAAYGSWAHSAPSVEHPLAALRGGLPSMTLLRRCSGVARLNWWRSGDLQLGVDEIGRLTDRQRRCADRGSCPDRPSGRRRRNCSSKMVPSAANVSKPNALNP